MLEKASRGEWRGEVNGDAVEDFVLLKGGGTKPGGARGLTPRRGEETGVEPRGICHGAGDALRKTVCRIGGGEVAPEDPSLYLHSMSSIAFSREFPDSVVSLLSSSSNLSVLSSSSSVASFRTGRQISYVESETIFAEAVYVEVDVVNECKDD